MIGRDAACRVSDDASWSPSKDEMKNERARGRIATAICCTVITKIA